MVELEQIIVSIRQLEIYGEGAVLELFRIHDDTHVIQHGLCVHALRGGADAQLGCLWILPGAVSQLKGRYEVSVSPCAGLRLIPKLLQRVRAQAAGFTVFRVGKYQRVRDLRDPLILALFIIGARHLKHPAGVAEVRHELFGIFARLQLIQMDRVCVVPAHVFLIDRLDIVLQRAVILPGIPYLFQVLRQLDHGGDLRGGVPLVDVQKGLVVDELIDRRRVGQIFADVLFTPMRPVVRLKDDLGVGEERLRLGDVTRPAVRVPHLRAAQRIEIVHRPAAILRHPQSLAVGEIGVHLGRGFRPRRLLEDHPHAVNGRFKNRLCDLVARRNIADAVLHRGQSDANRKTALLAVGQHGAILKKRPPLHCRADKDVFLHHRVRIALRHDDRGLSGGELLVERQAAVRDLLGRDQSLDTAIVVHMRMADHNGDDPPIAHLGAEELQRLLRGISAAAAVHDDPSVLAADEGDIGNIVAAHLIDAVGDLKKAVNVV